MHQLQIASLSKSDLDSIVELESKVHPFAWSRQAHLDSIEAGYPSLVLTENNQLIGFVIFNYLSDECHLLDIAVDRQHLRQGHAKRLLSAMLEKARQAGMIKVILEVRASNLAALNLYLALGFERIGLRKNYYRGYIDNMPKQEKGREDAIVMEKAL
ncbi:ribosomal protein S18-alanine N-acetyltransferase [Kangiella sp. TOML190]|uniref:ribosomal protein S18-alanine N-acetyltransferase n=1 Tax=Kangiella sp. TOML190 TaxID=2931351 RepID=UPI00203D505D|nr:ribosomal protein S18-alanine N-acetyltransferase [Kangiella sp. TOML190]